MGNNTSRSCRHRRRRRRKRKCQCLHDTLFKHRHVHAVQLAKSVHDLGDAEAKDGWEGGGEVFGGVFVCGEKRGKKKNGLVRKGGREGGRENHRISQSQPTDHTKQPLAARTTRIHTPRCIKAKSPGVHIRAPSIPAHAAARYFILAYPLGDVWVEELHGGN